MIINLTAQPSTPEQGVTDLRGAELLALKKALAFDATPMPEEITKRAEYIANIAVHNGLGKEGEDPLPDAAMIGGPIYLMAPLEQALLARGIAPLYPIIWHVGFRSFLTGAQAPLGMAALANLAPKICSEHDRVEITIQLYNKYAQD